MYCKPNNPDDLFTAVGKYTPYRLPEGTKPDRAAQMDALLAATSQKRPRRLRIVWISTCISAIAALMAGIYFLMPTVAPQEEHTYAEVLDSYCKSLTAEELETYNEFADADIFLEE